MAFEEGGDQMVLEELPCLLYSYPTDLDNTFKAVLSHDIICLGRLGPQAVEPPGAGLVQLSADVTSVSVKHAQIVRTSEGYELRNWKGRFGIGLYERDLQPGDAHVLKHCDVFRIPNLEQHIKFRFLEQQKKTLAFPLQVERNRGRVYVFGESLKLTPMEYRLIAHLHQKAERLCLYDELIAAIWTDEPNPVQRKGDLEVLLTQVRKKLRDASGGFSFMQTVTG